MRLRKHRSPVQVLNITPLIDVVFIILVFFMLATNFADFRLIGIDTPRETEVVMENEAAIAVLLKADGGMDFDGEPIEPKDLEARVADVIAIDRGRRFLIRPERGVPFQRTIDAYGAVEDGGARLLSFSRPADAAEAGAP